MEKVWLGLGSNLGDRARFLNEAIRLLGHWLEGMRVSAFWESRARYVEDQPDFVNAVLSGETVLSPRSLLAECMAVEAFLGRDRSSVAPKGPRCIDVDILLYGDRIVAEEGLIIPHPGMRDRKFVLLPLLRLDPGLVDPVSGDSFASMLAGLPPQGIYPYPGERYDAPYP